MQRPIFAANWKMNHGPTQARAFMAAFLATYSPRSDRTVVLFPPAMSFTTVRDALGSREDIALGVQNIYFEDKGAFTGETSAPMAIDAGAELALVGHSERRHVFGETDEQTAKKCAAAFRAALTPMLCVGETLAQRESGDTERVVLQQLEAVATALGAERMAQLVVAYEPVWAIGTGRNATPDDAATVHSAIRRWFAARMTRGKDVPILYGGSVNAKNASALLSAPGVDGLLVGGASLDPEAWTAICRT
jgi:triosephosphate isomerase (TIM)